MFQLKPEYHLVMRERNRKLNQGELTMLIAWAKKVFGTRYGDFSFNVEEYNDPEYPDDASYTYCFNGSYITANANWDKFELGYKEEYDNGHWEPPDFEYVIVSTQDSIYKSFMDMLKLWMGTDYQGYRESKYEEDETLEY